MENERGTLRGTPADDAGHRGSYTVPQDTLGEPAAGDLPTTGKLSEKATDRGLNVTVILTVAGIALAFAYCMQAGGG